MRNRSRISVTLLFAVFLLSSLVTFVNGSSLSAYAPTPPTIDGNIQAGEWAAAATATIPPFGPGNVYSGTLYMMNDATNLYIGVSIKGDAGLSADDNVRFYFDNGHVGGSTRAQGDDDIIAEGTFVNIGDLFYDSTCPCDQWDNLFGGTVDGQVASSRQGNVNMFELSHPLDDADTTHDFHLSKGQIVGFAMTVVIDTTWITNIPGFGTYSNPSTYANYVIAEPQIPEYPLGLPLLAIFMVISFGLIRRRTSTKKS